MPSPRLNRGSSRRNSPSFWSSFKLGGTQSVFRCSRKPLNNTLYVSDIQRCILWAMYVTQFGQYVLVTISPTIFLNGYLLPMWKRHINLATKSITFNRCLNIMTGVPVLTIWRRHSHILHSKVGKILTLQIYSTYCLLLIDSHVHPEPICYNSKQFRRSTFSAQYHSRHIIWEKWISAVCAVASINLPQRCIKSVQNSQLWTPIPCVNWRGLGTQSYWTSGQL